MKFDLDLITEFDFLPIVQGFHGACAAGAACQQGTLAPPDTWSCPTLGLACVLVSGPVSPGLVLSPGFWVSGAPRCFSFALNEFCYLGILLNYNGKFLVSQKQLAHHGRKAMFAMRSNVSDLELNHCTLFSLFDTYVASILLYGCEVWGSHAGNDVEKVHLDFCKNVLGVK